MRRVLTLGALLAGVVAAPALAHGTFVDARPLPGVEVGGSVDEVEFLFPEAVSLEGATISVTAPDGSEVPLVGSMTTGVEGLVRQSIEPLDQVGEHRIDYAIPSFDGTTFEGAFVFRYDPAAEPLEPLPFGRDTDMTIVLIALGMFAVVVVAGGLVARARMRRLRGSATSPGG